MRDEGRGSGKREFPRGGEQRASLRASVENREVLKIKVRSPNTSEQSSEDRTSGVLFDMISPWSKRHFKTLCPQIKDLSDISLSRGDDGVPLLTERKRPLQMH